MINILIVSYSYIAALIGAGFASGQEILCYFNSHGIYGICGITAAAIIFTMFALCILLVCVKYDISDYSVFLDAVCHKRMKKMLKTASGIFSFAVYSVMLAAFGEIGRIVTGLSPGICAAICAAFCAFMFCAGVDRVLDLNGLIGLILAAGIITCCLYMLRYREHHVFSEQMSAYTNAAVYSGYNLIPAAPVLTALSKRIHKKRDAFASALIAGGALLLMTSLIFAILSIYHGKIDLGSFPMLTLAQRQSDAFAFIYLLLFSGAVITTLFSSGAAVTETFSLGKPYIFLFSALSYLAAGAGFGRLIDTAYRICGIAGFALTLYMTVACLKKIISPKNKKV